PILAEVSTQEPIVAEVSTQEPITAEVRTEAPIMEDVTQEFSVEDVSSEDEGTDDDDDVDEDFLVDEENKIIEPDVDVYLFGISMDLPFDNIGITNLGSNDVLEGEDVDVINADGFDSDPGNDEGRNYKKRRLAKLRTEMKGVINVSGQWKYSFYTGQKFTSPKEAKEKVYLHSIEIRSNLKLYKNDSVRIRARCEEKVHVFTMSQGTGPTGPYSRTKAGPSGSSGLTTRRKKRIQCLGDDIDLHPKLNFTFIYDRQKVFNDKIIRGRDKPVITLLEYIKEYCMKRIMNVQGMIDKCTSPFSPTTTRIMESIKNEAHLMKVQWNGANKYQVSGGNNTEGSGSASRQAQQLN
nr:hypothetical protein [Tanacetum cinerariifolium]